MNRHSLESYRPPQGRLLSEINVTPFIDVMLVLLIIFMVTAPLMMAGVPLKLPKASAQAVKSVHQPVVVSLDKDHRLFIGDQPVEEQALSARIGEMLKGDAETTVYIRADRQVDYGQIMELLAHLGEAGAVKLSLVAEGQSLPQPKPVAP